MHYRWWKSSSSYKTHRMRRRITSDEFSSARRLSSSLLLQGASLHRAKVASYSPRQRTSDFRGSTCTTSSLTRLLQRNNRRAKISFHESKSCLKKATATNISSSHITISTGLCSSNCSSMIRSFTKALAVWMFPAVRRHQCAIQPIKGPKKSLKPCESA